jgi:hypothetical protein
MASDSADKTAGIQMQHPSEESQRWLERDVAQHPKSAD